MSVLSDLTASEEYAEVTARFAAMADSAAAADWDRPAPVPGWTAREVVRHLVDWFPPFLRDSAGIALAPVGSVDDDPATAWRQRTSDLAAVLAESGTRRLSHPQIGTMAVAEAVDRFYTTDVFLHRWDLARAFGLDPDLEETRCARFLAGAEPYEDVMRSSGQYGPRVPVPADAPLQDRVAGFIGRDPTWHPETR